MALSPTANRTGLLLFATLYTFFYVGALFGWGPMQRMLEGSGAFDQQCPADTTTTMYPCQLESTVIVGINFVATTTNTMTPFMGQAIDVYGGPKVAMYFMSPCAIIGAFIVMMTAYAHTYEYNKMLDALYFLGFSFLGLATFCGSLLNVQVGLYFTGQMQVRAIMFLNALFDAGSVTYLILWYTGKSFDVPFETIMTGYFVLAILCYGGGVYFWSVAETEQESRDALEEFAEGEGEALLSSPALRKEIRESLREFQAAHMDNPEEIRQTMLSYRSNKNNKSGGSQSLLPEPYGSVEMTTTGDDIPSIEDEYVLLADRSPKDQLLSFPYIMLTCFFAINMISTNWTLATAADFLKDLGDTDGFYLSLFTIMQPASVFALPLVDATVQRFGFGTAFQCVNGLAFTYILIKLVSDDLNVQIVTFLMVAVVRCYLFAVTFSFLPRLLSPNAVGKGTGFLYMVGGVASFLNIPLNALVLKTGFFPPNLLYLILTIPTTFMALVVQITIRKENKAKKAKGLLVE
jgi:hypothetical protein